MPKSIQVTLIPNEILDAEDLKPVDVRILIELRRVERKDDGSVHVKARRLALRANCDEKTVANRIRLMATNGWLKILEVSEGGGGGFRIQFLRAAVIACLLLSPAALHKLSPMDNSVRDFTQLHIISHSKKRKRRASLPTTTIEQVRQHPRYSQLSEWNHAAAGAAS